MKRWVYTHTTVEGRPAELDRLLRGRLRDLLMRATNTPPQAPDADGTFLIGLEGGLAGLQPTKDVRVRTDVAETAEGRTRIGVAWHAEPGRHAFPAFEGAFELEALSRRHAQLTLVGAYRMPFGPIGKALDGLTLHGVADRTVRSLVQGVGEELERMTEESPPQVVEGETVSPRSMRVCDLMTLEPMVLDEDLSLRSAAMLLLHRGVQGAPVVSETGALVGVLSEHDLLEKQAAPRTAGGRTAKDADRRRAATTAGEACSRPARVTVPDASLRSAARAMLDHGVARLVVVDGSAIVGIITRRDVLRALLRSDADILAAIDDVLGTYAEPEIEAVVVWGEATLTGTASTRSQARAVANAIAEIDGVVTVRGEPRWREDDRLPVDYAIRGF